MQAQLTGMLEWQLDAKDAAAARVAAEREQEAQAIKAAWRREEEAAAAVAQEQLARQKADSAATLEANRRVLALQAAHEDVGCACLSSHLPSLHSLSGGICAATPRSLFLSLLCPQAAP